MASILRLLLSLIIAGLLLVGCAQQAQPTPTLPVKLPDSGVTVPGVTKTPVATKEAWEVKWDRVLQEAKKEGKVVVYGGGGGGVREALSEAFQKKYGIPVEHLAAPGPEIAAKILSERKAGLYIPDAILSTSTPTVSQLKPAGVLDPLEPLLILPEVVDPKVWWENEVPWVDRDHYFVAFMAYVDSAAKIVTNADMVKPEEIKGFRDLLDPKWKGKMVMHDPTIAGTGNSFIGMMTLHNIMGGVDYLRQLASQVALLSRDHRLLTEWVARGKYPIGITIEPDPVNEMKLAGAPLKYVSPIDANWVATGTGFLSLPKNAPHPNASAVFINWLLSREGQIVYSNVIGLQSARVDVPTTNLDPLFIRKPGVKYLKMHTEEFYLKGPDWAKLGVEIFGPLKQ